MLTTTIRRNRSQKWLRRNATDRGRDQQLEPKLKVCVLAACPFPANHGTPGSIRELVEATVERGHEVHVVTYHIGEDLPLQGAHLHRIPDLTGDRQVIVGPTKLRPLYDLQMVFKAIQVIRRYRLDLIHAHGYESALVAACCRPIVRRPILYSAHNRMGDELASYDFFPSKRVANALAWVLDRTVPRIGDRCVPHSVNLQQFLSARGLAGRSEPVLNFGVDVERQRYCSREELRRNCGIGDEPVVLYSGVIDQFQRVDLLLGAMVHVLRRMPRAKLLLLSTIPNAKHEQELRAEAERLGISGDVILKVPTDMERGLRLLPICDVAVVPRPGTPGFPIKLLNYMIAQRPCVVYASSTSALTHGENVWMAAEDTSESLGLAITRVLKDDGLRSRIAAGGYRFVRERHDRRRVAAILCGSYVRLLQETRRWQEVASRPSPKELTFGNSVGCGDVERTRGFLEAEIDARA
ncbi:MAG TPA: glycosyltransferase family 4 protein [Lacipirellulaceae bacterium]|jgi:glycosyltransferase involved in cell wall biosynthesis|nr:glycosyltransferase family 4 protein [Lacipirellulaceae bacterium]